MEFVRNRLKTLHIIMLVMIGLFAIAAAIYFTRADNGVYDAADVLGQYDPPVTTYPRLYTDSDPWNSGGSANAEGFSGNSQMVIDPTTQTLFVADTASNRVLVYTLGTDGTRASQTASYALGQPDLTSSSPGTSDNQMSGPEGLAIDLVNRQLFVADTGNNRVLVFNIQSGVNTGIYPLYIIGQPDGFTTDPGTSQTLLNQPTGLDFDHDTNILYIADTGNNRVIVTDGIQGFQAGGLIGQSGMSFSYVIGQTDFDTATSGLSGSKFSAPRGVDVNTNGTILVTDTGNNRVLSFDGGIAANGNSATRVIGQVNVTLGTSGLTDVTLNAPTSAVWDYGRGLLYVADTGNNRVLAYDVAGGVFDGMSATFVIGQTDFVSGSAAVTQSRLSAPASVFVLDVVDEVAGSTMDAGVRENIWISDSSNNRVLLLDYETPASPTAGQAIDVFGHFTTSISAIGTTPRFTNSSAYSGDSSPNSFSFSQVKENYVDTTHHRLFVQDNTANRILIFNLDSSNNLIDRNADNVIGKPDFTTASGFINQHSFYSTDGMAYDVDNDLLFVGDNNRILVFDVRPSNSTSRTLCGFASTGLSDNMDASCVLGQNDFISNGNMVGASSITATRSLAYDSVNERLFATDGEGAGLKVFDFSGGISNNMAAVTLGYNTAFFYNRAVDIAYDSLRERLFVAVDRIEEETSTWGGLVWVYDASAITPGEYPVNVLGTTNVTVEPDNSISAVNVSADDNQCADDSGYPTYIENWEADIICDSVGSIMYAPVTDRLYVSSRAFSPITRITVFDTETIINGEDAVAVLGQQDFVSEVNGGVAQSTLGSLVTGMSIDETNNRLYISDGDSHRVLIYDFVRPVAQSLPSGTAGTAYNSVSFSTENAQGNSSLVAVSGIPAGMTFDTNSLELSGTPAVAGTYNVVLRAVDEFGASTFYGNRTYSLSIAGGNGGGGGDPIDICTDTLANNYNQQNTCEYDAPELSIAAPVSVVSPATSATYTSSANSIVVSGTATDRDTVTSVMYSLNGSTPVAAIGIASWTTSNLMLVPGPNTFTVTASNNHNLQASKSLTIVYGTTPPPNCTTNPSLPGCNPVDPPNCTNTPSLPGCNPIDPPNCTNTPSLPGCNPVDPPETCATNPSLPSCIPIDPGGPIIPEPPTVPDVVPGAVSTDDISTYAMVASRIGIILGMIAAIFAGSVALSELAFLPQRIWQMILGAIGFKKRTRRWGTVYDSVTKQPLDPVYVTLTTSAGKEVATSITDIDGRFGFLVEPGAYRIWVNKTNYLFPSRKLAGRDYDEIYKDLYFGEEFVVQEKDDVFAKNIPMDPVLFNWNEYVKHEQKLTKWNAKRDKIVNRIANTIFVIGFISSVIAAIIIPTTFNLILVGVYIILLLIRELGIKAYRSGFVEDKAGQPLAYGLVHIYSASLGKKLFTRPLDKYGRYFALVPKGEYYVTIDSKNADQSYTEVHKSKPFMARRGIINKKFTIS
ncbi:MAG: putative Ig domain-containing protein [Candidatus Pacebacteria bacterium]|nr:putative Ig domain-containing protein [Candidatus Paceibacterota bacterium]MBP9852018.1 putative Ig domain-containing protein [Candidatus Paceibacterota bacterium]